MSHLQKFKVHMHIRETSFLFHSCVRVGLLSLLCATTYPSNQLLLQWPALACFRDGYKNEHQNPQISLNLRY